MRAMAPRSSLVAARRIKGILQSSRSRVRLPASDGSPVEMLLGVDAACLGDVGKRKGWIVEQQGFYSLGKTAGRTRDPRGLAVLQSQACANWRPWKRRRVASPALPALSRWFLRTASELPQCSSPNRAGARRRWNSSSRMRG